VPKVEKQRDGLTAFMPFRVQGSRLKGKILTKMLDPGVLSAYITADD
jgi:hypothetical protein